MKREDFLNALSELDDGLLVPVADDAAGKTKRRPAAAFILVAACLVAVTAAAFALSLGMREPTTPPSVIADATQTESATADVTDPFSDTERKSEGETADAADTDTSAAVGSTGTESAVTGPDAGYVSERSPEPTEPVSVPYYDSEPTEPVSVPDHDPEPTGRQTAPAVTEDDPPAVTESEPPDDRTAPTDIEPGTDVETGLPAGTETETRPAETDEAESTSDIPFDPEGKVTKDDLCRYVYTRLENSPDIDLPGMTNPGSDPSVLGGDHVGTPDESSIISEDEYGSVWFYSVVERYGYVTKEELKSTARMYKRIALRKDEMAWMLIEYLEYKYPYLSCDELLDFAVRGWHDFSDADADDAYAEETITAYLIGLIEPVNEEVLGVDELVTEEELDAAIERLIEIVP